MFPFFNSYLPEYLWREKVKREGGDLFLALLKLIAEKQKDQNPETDQAEVGNIILNSK